MLCCVFRFNRTSNKKVWRLFYQDSCTQLVIRRLSLDSFIFDDVQLGYGPCTDGATEGVTRFLGFAFLLLLIILKDQTARKNVQINVIPYFLTSREFKRVFKNVMQNSKVPYQFKKWTIRPKSVHIWFSWQMSMPFGDDVTLLDFFLNCKIYQNIAVFFKKLFKKYLSLRNVTRCVNCQKLIYREFDSKTCLAGLSASGSWNGGYLYYKKVRICQKCWAKNGTW